VLPAVEQRELRHPEDEDDAPDPAAAARQFFAEAKPPEVAFDELTEWLGKCNKDQLFTWATFS
jgi:hypothetical protein